MSKKKSVFDNIQDIQRTQLGLLTMMLGGLQEIAKCDVSQGGAIAMKHIAEKTLVNVHKLAMGESLEGTTNAEI